MIDLSSIRGRHRGQSCAVLGGGPTLLRDLRDIPLDAVLFGVNQHTMLLNLDYIVFLDREVYPVVAEGDAPLITHHRDLAHIYSGICPEFGLSSAAAVWIAEYLECSPIYLAGMDNYTASRRYWHSMPSHKCPELGENANDVWRKVATHLRHPDRVRAISGPLTEVFPNARADAA